MCIYVLHKFRQLAQFYYDQKLLPFLESLQFILFVSVCAWVSAYVTKIMYFILRQLNGGVRRRCWWLCVWRRRWRRRGMLSRALSCTFLYSSDFASYRYETKSEFPIYWYVYRLQCNQNENKNWIVRWAHHQWNAQHDKRSIFFLENQKQNASKIRCWYTHLYKHTLLICTKNCRHVERLRPFTFII